jgi:hypothetical protein
MSKLTTAVCAAIALSAFGLTQDAWAGPKNNKGGASANAPKGSTLAPGKTKPDKQPATGVGQATAPGKNK